MAKNPIKKLNRQTKLSAPDPMAQPTGNLSMSSAALWAGDWDKPGTQAKRVLTPEQQPRLIGRGNPGIEKKGK